jgi:hypothetical protein
MATVGITTGDGPPELSDDIEASSWAASPAGNPAEASADKFPAAAQMLDRLGVRQLAPGMPLVKLLSEEDPLINDDTPPTPPDILLPKFEVLNRLLGIMLLSALADAVCDKFVIEPMPGTDIVEVSELFTTEEIDPIPPGKLLTPLAIEDTEFCNAPDPTACAACVSPVALEMELFTNEVALANPPTVGIELFIVFVILFTEEVNPANPVLGREPVIELLTLLNELYPMLDVAAPNADSGEVDPMPPLIPTDTPPIVPDIDPDIEPDTPPIIPDIEPDTPPIAPDIEPDTPPIAPDIEPDTPPIAPDIEPDIEPDKLLNPPLIEELPPKLDAAKVTEAACFANAVRF